jgi:hypothetical protein
MLQRKYLLRTSVVLVELPLLKEVYEMGTWCRFWQPKCRVICGDWFLKAFPPKALMVSCLYNNDHPGYS